MYEKSLEIYTSYKLTWTLPIVGIMVYVWIYSRVLLQKIRASEMEVGTRGRKDVEIKHSVPYGRFSHPHKSFVDRFIIPIVFYFIIPLHKIIQENPRPSGYLDDQRNDNGGNGNGNGNRDDGKNDINNHHDQESYSNTSSGHKNVTVRSKREGALTKVRSLDRPIPPSKAWYERVRKNRPNDFLVGGTVKVPRRPNLVNNRIPQALQPSTFHDNDPMVQVEITCPRSALLEEEGETESKSCYTLVPDDDGKISSKDGYRRFVTCDLAQLKFTPSAQLLVYFHGGGFAIGSPRDHQSNFLCEQLFAIPSDEQDNEEKSNEEKLLKQSPLVVLEVKYRCIPENPFPASIIDALSVTTFLAEQFPQCSIHISGVSAGGNLAAVVYFECKRFFQHQQLNSSTSSNDNGMNCSKIHSLTVVDPFLDPATSSVSYHMNSKQPYIDTAFLRWCWATYLQLDDPRDEKLIDFSSESSYYDSWSKSKWCDVFRNQPEVGRLVRPDLDLRSSIVSNAMQNDDGSGSGSGTIIITTSMADPLRDEGVEFVKNVRKAVKDCPGYTVHHFSGRGSHTLSLTFDAKARKQFSNAFRKAIWS